MTALNSKWKYTKLAVHCGSRSCDYSIRTLPVVVLQRMAKKSVKKNIETRAHAAIFVSIKEPFELWRPCFRRRHCLLKLPIVLFAVSQD